MQKTEAERLFAPYANGISKAITRGFKKSCSISSAVAADLSPSTKAAMHRDLIVKALETSGFEDVLEHQGQLLFRLPGGILFRIKKLSKAGISSNYPTRHAQELSSQMEIKGLPPAARLDVGYVLDESGTTIERIQVAQLLGLRRIDWAFELAMPRANVVPVPLLTDALEKRTRIKRVRPKGELRDDGIQTRSGDRD